MIEWPLLLVAGALGSSHCLGMCGPFALALGSGARGWPENLLRQLLYTLGRLFTYVVLGACAGFAGSRLAHYSGTLVNVPAVLAVLAGLVLCWQGLLATGLLSRGTRAGIPCLAGSFFARFLRQRQASSVFLAGLFTGLLPCGLLYGILALAASTHAVGNGIAVMAVFALGTAPAMIAAGLSGSLLGAAFRKHVFVAAAWCLVLTGVISIARGGAVLMSTSEKAAACPFCAE